MVRTERLALVPLPLRLDSHPTRNPNLGHTLMDRREAVLSLKGRNNTSPPAPFFFFLLPTLGVRCNVQASLVAECGL